MPTDNLYEEIKEHFDRCAPHYGMVHIDMPYIDGWQFGNLLDVVDTGKAPTVLDLGTGDGNLLLQIGQSNSACRLIGIDLSDKMLDVARANLRRASLDGEFHQHNVETIPLEAESVDYVVSNGALHHVEDKRSLYSEIFRVLKPGGTMFVIDGFDIVDDYYETLQDDLKSSEPEFWDGYLSDYERYMDYIRRELPAELADHPVEFHIPPLELKELLEFIGFGKVNIKPSPTHVAIYTGSKPQHSAG